MVGLRDERYHVGVNHCDASGNGILAQGDVRARAPMGDPQYITKDTFNPCFTYDPANSAHAFLPGSTLLEKDGTFINAGRRITRVRKVMAPRNGYADREVTQLLAKAMGAEWHYTHPSQIMDEIAATTPGVVCTTFHQPDTQESVITTDYSDWATNCPEYTARNTR